MQFLEGIYNFENYDGLLFVGDPHIASFRPESRTDDNFMETVLNKLEQAVGLCITYNLYMVILGDLFHDDKDHNVLMLTRLIRLFKQLPNPPVTIIGNHEKTQTKLTDDTFTAVMREAGALYTIEKNQYWGRFKINNEFFYLGGTPYGQTIPTDVTPYIRKDFTEILSYTIWLTHHDLGIGTFYPGCIEPREIEGCDIVVNGHDHTYKDPVVRGQTTYFNPGNITRMSVDKKDHEPRVWAWWPKEKRTLVPFNLKYNPNSFNLTGRQVIVADNAPTFKEKEVIESKFLQLLENNTKNQHAADMTSDAAVVEKNIESLSSILSVSKTLTDELIEIAKDCSRELR